MDRQQGTTVGLAEEVGQGYTGLAPTPPQTTPDTPATRMAALAADVPCRSSTSFATPRNSMRGNGSDPRTHPAGSTTNPNKPHNKRSSAILPPSRRSDRRTSGPHNNAPPARATRSHGTPRSFHARREPYLPNDKKWTLRESRSDFVEQVARHGAIAVSQSTGTSCRPLLSSRTTTSPR